MIPPRTVLAQYDLQIPPQPQALGNAGGFSGARLWRVSDSLGDWRLRAWPVGETTPSRLEWIHQLMYQARQVGLAFIPAILPARAGTTFVDEDGQLWDVCAWMPGVADYCRRPSAARLEAACTALAKVHQAWRPTALATKPCPGWLRRRAKALAWLRLIQSWRPQFSALDPLAEAAKQVLTVLVSLGPWLQREVLHREAPLVAVQPCLCDPWHDHVLFTGDEVTGLIDFGSVKEDHIAVDLARLLGSLVEDDKNAWSVGLTAYQKVRSLTTDEISLARQLDRTGVVLAATTWLRWLFVENREFENRNEIAERLMKLVRRLEAWKRA